MTMTNIPSFLNQKLKKNNCDECISCVFKFLQKYNLHSAAYSNLYILYKYILTLACTQTNCERAFSKLKIIKNRLRSTMEQDLLNAQLLLSIENDYLPDTEKIIDKISELSTTFSKLLHI